MAARALWWAFAAALVSSPIQANAVLAANPFDAQGRRLESRPPDPEPPPPPPPPPPAPVHSEYFSFRVCNQSGVKISVALSHHVSAEDNRFRVVGWYNVEAGDCHDIGSFAKGWFYYHAEPFNSKYRIEWGSDVMKLCVTYPGPFDYVNVKSKRCNSNRLKRFYAEFIEYDRDEYSVNLN